MSPVKLYVILSVVKQKYLPVSPTHTENRYFTVVKLLEQYMVNFNVTLTILSKDEEKTKELIKISE